MRAPATSAPRLALAAVLVLPLAACGGEGEQPTTLPTRSADASTPGTPSSPGSASGPAATGASAEVEAAVRGYYDTLTRASRTNDPALLADLVAPGCPCAEAMKVIRRNARNGETTPEATFTVASVRAHDVEGGVAVAEVAYRASAYDVLDESGDVVTTIRSRRRHLDLSLVRSDDGAWVITNVTDLEAG